MELGRTPGATVTSRALRILEAFRADRRELSLSQLARSADLPLSTTHRLADELVRWGALERDRRDRRGRYRIGLRLWEIGALAPRLGLREVALPFLEDLYEATHENVQLAVLDGQEVLYVERISGRGSVGAVSRVGGRLPLHATAVGQVLLAHGDAQLQERVMAGPMRACTSKTITSPHLLRRVLADIRRTGVAVCDGQVDLCTMSIAAGIRDASDQVVAALSVVVPADRPVSIYIPAVRAAARGVSRAIGLPGGLRGTPAIPGSGPPASHDRPNAPPSR
jgi:DNA-binding IclR family transcriptional regulator